MEKIFDVMGCEDAFKTRLAVYKFEGNVAWWKAYKQAKGGDAWLPMLLATMRSSKRGRMKTLSDQTSAAGTAEEQAKNLQWGLRRSTLNHLMCMSYTDVAQVANTARNYEILHERDHNDTERPDKRQKSGEVVVTTTAVATTTTLAVTTGVPVMDVTRGTGVSSPIEMPILVLRSPGVPLRATPIQFALLVDADTQESVVELLVLASSVVKLAIYRKIARRTPL
nr:hypothetical protein [Tanacetum cinerariifolium]